MQHKLVIFKIMESQEEKKIGLIGKILGKKNEQDFSAERAWIESTYGEDCYVPISERIKEKQDHIKSSIKSKFRQNYQNNIRSFFSYHCVIDIEDDLAAHVETVFKPFVDNGFTIINLSDKVEEIDEPHVYLVSWKNAFKNAHKETEIDLTKSLNEDSSCEENHKTDKLREAL